MLHEDGIFVFESKNYSGWIFGSEGQKQWVQSLKGGHKERFCNPNLQNRSHISALARYLALDLFRFFSFIVFSERCELKRVPADTESFSILRRHHLVEAVNRILQGRERVFTNEEMDSIAQRLAALGKTEEKAEAHIETVRGIQNGTICPWCGAPLVQREGKRGPFMGCSSFPRCRFIRNI